MKTADRFLWQWAPSLVNWELLDFKVWYHRDTDLLILNMLVLSLQGLSSPILYAWILDPQKERGGKPTPTKKLQQTIKFYFFLSVNLWKIWYYFDTKKPCPQIKPTQYYSGLAMSNSARQSSARASTCSSMNLLRRWEDVHRECNHSALQSVLGFYCAPKYFPHTK